MARKPVAPPPQPAASSSGGEQEEEEESSYSSSQDQEVADKEEEAVVEQHRGEEDGDPSDMTPQPKKTKAPSAELAKSRQKRVKALAHHRGEVDGDPSDKAPQPKKTNVPSADLAKSLPPKKSKKAPAQQLGEEEGQTADSSNSEPSETAPHRDPLPKRNVLRSHRPAAPKRMKEAPPKPKSKRVRRTWAPNDEAQILEALAEHRREYGHPPLRCNNIFFDSLAERLEDKSWGRNEIKDKMNSLRRRYLSNSGSTTENEDHLYDLSDAVWGGTAGAENDGQEQRDFDEMCGLYPHLAQEINVLAEIQPTVKTSFPRLDDSRARLMEAKLEKVSWAKVKMQVQMEIKVQVPTAKVRKELVNLLMEMR